MNRKEFLRNLGAVALSIIVSKPIIDALANNHIEVISSGLPEWIKKYPLTPDECFIIKPRQIGMSGLYGDMIIEDAKKYIKDIRR